MFRRVHVGGFGGFVKLVCTRTLGWPGFNRLRLGGVELFFRIGRSGFIEAYLLHNERLASLAPTATAGVPLGEGARPVR